MVPTSDHVPPKLKFARLNEKHTGHSARWEKLEAKLNVQPNHASV